MAINPNIRRTILVVAGILLSVFFIVVSVRNMDWHQVFVVLSNARLYPWLIFAVAIYLAGHFFRGLRTRLLISREARLSVITASNIVIVGYAVNNIMPARAGELARAGMLSERTGIPFAQSVTVVFLERILDGIAIVLLLTAAAVFLHDVAPIPETIFYLSLVFSIAAVFIMFVALAPHRFMAAMSKVIYALYPRWHDATVRFMTSIVNGMAYLRRPVDACKIFIISVVVWLCDGGLFFCLMPACGMELNIARAVFVMGVSNLGVFFLTSPGYGSPGYIGPLSFLCINAFVSMSVPQATATGFAIMMQLAIYIPIMIWGGAVILWYGITLGLTMNLAKKAKVITGLPDQLVPAANLLGTTFSETISDTASLFIYKLTEAALPLDSYKLTNQQEIISYVADFIQGEIRNLSKKIQVLFSIGMFGFGTLVWLRYLRTFSQLPLTRRISIYNGWAYGKIPVTRQLFKLVRSTALLAFFEHPAVMNALKNQEGNNNFSARIQ